MLAAQSLDVSECSGMTAEGLVAMAALTQLTALNASWVEWASETGPSGMRIADAPEVLGLLSRLTGAAP